MDTYVQRRLFDPLAIRPGGWTKGSVGNAHGMAGLQLNARDAAKLGQLILRKGKSGKVTLLDAHFIEEMLAPSRQSQELGLLWWRRSAWTHFHVDAKSIDILNSVNTPPSWVAKLKPLVGRSFESAGALYDALAECLGSNWREIWTRDLTQPFGIGPWRPFHAEKIRLRPSKPRDTLASTSW